jgi:hypothetical protein
VHVSRLLHVVFGNCVAANDVSHTRSLASRVSEFINTLKPRKAVPYVEGMTHGSPPPSGQRKTLVATGVCQHGWHTAFVMTEWLDWLVIQGSTG